MRNDTIDSIQLEQGWNDRTLLNLVLDFVAEHSSEEHLEKWLQLKADNENAMAKDEGSEVCDKCGAPDTEDNPYNPDKGLCEACEDDEIAHEDK